MTPELYAALTTLGLAAITVLGYFVRYIGLQIQTKIDANTRITEQVEAQTNGELQKARNEAQKYRSAYDRAAKFGREQRWLIEELQRSPEGRALIDRIMQRRRAIIHDGDYDDLMRRLMDEAQEPIK
jgi:hypothetical protein